MCLAVPGRIEHIDRSEGALSLAGQVNFGGVVREINLALVPEAQVGDYVVAHVGMALCLLDEAEANASLALFKAIDGQGST